ncbi:MAG: type II secretion system F family protein [Methylophilus sp.]|uniref:type II secretion system F family protein n=1 Tax=Methylophilus sp. TaxID=29541 RepID=UPI003F9FB6AB
MNSYRYTAIDHHGRPQRGTLQAANEQALEASLQQQGLELLTVKIGQPQAWLQPRIQAQHLILFCIQMEQLLQAGVPLLQALEELAGQCEHRLMSEAVRSLHHELEAGKLLSQALHLQPQVFPALICHLVAAGEHTGQLPEIFGHLAQTLQWQAELIAQTKRGLTYPALLCVMVSVAAAVMLTFLVPQMVGFLHSLGQELPWSTRMLLGLSDWVVAYGGIMLVVLVLLVAGVRSAIKRSPAWALYWDQKLLQLPVIGRLCHQLVLTRLCRFLGLMYQTGIPLLQALEWCQPLLHNRAMAQALNQVQQRVQAGEGLASSFAASGCFPSLLVRMIRVGETTGVLDRMLAQQAAFYDREVQAQIQLLLRLLEPLLTIVLGLMLLFLMAAVMLPVYDSFSTLRY